MKNFLSVSSLKNILIMNAMTNMVITPLTALVSSAVASGFAMYKSIFLMMRGD
jgi:hypothetical protein